eukprot:5925046-Amphidinium_carterae.1
MHVSAYRDGCEEQAQIYPTSAKVGTMNRGITKSLGVVHQTVQQQMAQRGCCGSHAGPGFGLQAMPH